MLKLNKILINNYLSIYLYIQSLLYSFNRWFFLLFFITKSIDSGVPVLNRMINFDVINIGLFQ